MSDGGAGQGASCARYAGPDRRHRIPDRPHGLDRQALIAFAAVAFIGAVVAPLALGVPMREPGLVQLAAVLRSIGAAMFFGAGLMRLARWQATGEAPLALNGIALMSFATLTFPPALVTGLVHATPTTVALSPATHLIATLAASVLLTMALRSPQVNSALRPRRLLLLTLMTAMGAFLVLVVAHQVWHVSFDPSSGHLAELELAAAAAWAGVAVAHLRHGLQTARRGAMLSAASLGMIAASGLFRAVSVGDLDPWLAGVAGLQLGAAVIALIGATADLSEVFAQEGARLLTVQGELALTEQTLTREEQRRQEQLHDARSLLAAVKAATGTLERYEDRLDESTKHMLRSAVVSELERLEHLIDPAARESTAVFDVAAALAGVVAAERQNGMTIHLQVHGVTAYGRASDVATVVQNLLVNARRHAPGSAVTIRTRPVGGDVRIYVEDSGPGIPITERESVFRRGIRGTGAAGDGSGLGLHVARRLMQAQDGAIEVRDRTGGGAMFVLSLPAVSARHQVEDTVEVAQPVERDAHVDSADGDAARLATLPRQRDDDVGTAGRVRPDDRQVERPRRRKRLRDVEAT